MSAQEKVQLNLCVDLGTNSLFRDLAKASGYGSRPSPFLGLLLQVYIGNMRSVAKRLARILEDNPTLLAGREQRFYAEEIVNLLNDALKK